MADIDWSVDDSGYDTAGSELDNYLQSGGYYANDVVADDGTTAGINAQIANQGSNGFFSGSDLAKLFKDSPLLQTLGAAGLGKLADKIFDVQKGPGGYKGGIPTLTASRQQLPIPTSMMNAAGTPMLDAKGVPIPRRPGSGGVTYFSPMQYLKPGQTPATPASTGIATIPTSTVPAESVAAPTEDMSYQVFSSGGITSLAGGGETVEQWAARQPDLTNVADPMQRKNMLESWQMQRPGYVNPMDFNNYESYAGAAGIRDEGGGSGQDLTNRTNFYGLTPENYQNVLSGDRTKPMGGNQAVYGAQLLSPLEQRAAEVARGQGISTMTPETAALAKKNPEVFNAASQKFQNYMATTYPGTLEYQSVLSGPMQFSSTGVKNPKILDSASMYILDKATGKIIKNPNYKPPKKMAMGGIANLGGYSDGGRLLKGPGDGVSDSIPATIGNKQPARLADGEFVIPARIVSELGNGSTEAGARKLYAMMDRIKKARGKAKNIAADTKSDKHLPA